MAQAKKGSNAWAADLFFAQESRYTDSRFGRNSTRRVADAIARAELKTIGRNGRHQTTEVVEIVNFLRQQGSLQDLHLRGVSDFSINRLEGILRPALKMRKGNGRTIRSRVPPAFRIETNGYPLMPSRAKRAKWE